MTAEDTGIITSQPDLLELVEAGVMGLAMGSAVLLSSLDLTTMWQSMIIAGIPSAFTMIRLGKDFGRWGRMFLCLAFGATVAGIVALIVGLAPTTWQTVGGAIFTVAGSVVGIAAIVGFVKQHRAKSAS